MERALKRLCLFSSIVLMVVLMVLFLWGVLCSLSAQWEAQSAFVMHDRQTKGASRTLQPQILAIPLKSRYTRLVLVIAETSTPLPKNEATATRRIAMLGRLVPKVNARAQPNNSQSDIAAFIRWPSNIAACFFAGFILFLFLKKERFRRKTYPGPPTRTPPGDLTPAQAGALVRGRVNGMLMQATLLYMACRGTLAIEVLGQNELLIHLRTPKDTRQGVEHDIWRLLSTTEQVYYAVTPPALKSNRKEWIQIQQALRQELISRGWFDPQVFRRKGFLFLGGVLSLWAALLDFLYAEVGQEMWGLVGITLFLGTAIILFMWAYTLVETTNRGEQLAAQWRAYRAGLDQMFDQLEDNVEMEQALPYALALGASRFLDHYIHLAATEDYHPGWLYRAQKTSLKKGELMDDWQTFLRTLRLPSLGLMPIIIPERRNAS